MAWLEQKISAQYIRRASEWEWLRPGKEIVTSVKKRRRMKEDERMSKGKEVGQEGGMAFFPKYSISNYSSNVTKYMFYVLPYIILIIYREHMKNYPGRNRSL